MTAGYSGTRVMLGNDILGRFALIDNTAGKHCGKTETKDGSVICWCVHKGRARVDWAHHMWPMLSDRVHLNLHALRPPPPQARACHPGLERGAQQGGGATRHPHARGGLCHLHDGERHGPPQRATAQ